MNKYYLICWQSATALLVGILLMISCIDEVDNVCRYPICFIRIFTIPGFPRVIPGEWVHALPVSAIQTGAGSLYLHTIYTDSITVSSPRAGGGVAVTRATPVDGAGCIVPSGCLPMLIRLPGTGLNFRIICMIFLSENPVVNGFLRKHTTGLEKFTR